MQEDEAVDGPEDAADDTAATTEHDDIVRMLRVDGRFQRCAARRDEQAAPAPLAPNTNFWRHCSWAADGAHVVAAQDDNVLQVLRFAHGALDGGADSASSPALQQNAMHAEAHQCSAEAASLTLAASIPQTESIYSCACYPHFHASDDGSTCIAASCRGQPVHLWDAFSGKQRCTYRTYDHADEITPAHSLCFHPAGDRYAALAPQSCWHAYDSRWIPAQQLLTWQRRSPRHVVLALRGARVTKRLVSIDMGAESVVHAGCWLA